MVCKNCKRQIDDDSIYCKFCGEKQIRERRKKTEVKVPKPRQLASGNLKSDSKTVSNFTLSACPEAGGRGRFSDFDK